MDFKLRKNNLNFRVYTAVSLPSTGAENDICVISHIPMKNWIMSPNKPSGTPRTDGDVWIQYSVNGETRNVLKNSAMLIALIKAYQYADGVWTCMPVVSRQNGVWADHIVYLYDDGEEFTDLTGGWKIDITPASSSWSKGSGTKNEDSIFLSCEAMQEIAAVTANKIDVTNLNTIFVKVDVCTLTGTNSNGWFGITDKASGNNYVTQVCIKNAGNFAVDVSDISGKYYVFVRADAHGSATSRVQFSEVKAQ